MTDFSDELLVLAEDALTHAMFSVSDGGDLIPFVVREAVDGRKLSRFVAGRLEESVDIARQMTQKEPAPNRAALAFDGYSSADDYPRMKTLFVEAYEQGNAVGLILRQAGSPLRRRRT